MSNDRHRLQSARRGALWAAILIFVSAGYFQNSHPGWNVNSQFALACALAERGTFRIDAYHETPILQTGDKAHFGDHYYTDKSPVTGMLGAPVVWVWRHACLSFGIPFHYETARWLAGWAVAGGSAALLAALIVLVLAARGLAPDDAARSGALWIAATPLLGYAVLFFNYLPACAFLMAGFYLAERTWREPGTAFPERGEAGRLFMAGVFVGLACWTLNTVAIGAVVLSALVAGGLWRRRERVLFGWWALGGLIGVAGYFVYNWAIFGSFQSPYAYEDDPFFKEQMRHGLMGATIPRPLVAALVTVLPFQGLLLWFPIAALALAGCFWLAARGKGFQRWEGFWALVLFFMLVLYTSAFFFWWGGWAYAPRHLLPALPMLALGLVPWFNRGHGRRIFFAVGLAGVVFNLAAIAVDPQVPPHLTQEELLVPGSVAHWPIPMLVLQEAFWIGGYADTNWGTALGLKGPASLLPLALIWGFAWWGLGRWTRGEESRKSIA